MRDNAPRNTAATERKAGSAILNGLKCRCPACGKGKLFGKYLKPVARCEACLEDMSGQQADDAPPYFTIFIVGHVVAGLALSVEQTWAPEVWVHMAYALPLTLGLSLGLLQPIKGAVIGLQWAMRMHGFSTSAAEEPAS
jgi:uncharacterized protein (DUF983 family)